MAETTEPTIAETLKKLNQLKNLSGVKRLLFLMVQMFAPSNIREIPLIAYLDCSVAVKIMKVMQSSKRKALHISESLPVYKAVALCKSATLPKVIKLHLPVGLALGVVEDAPKPTSRGWVHFRRTLAIGVLRSAGFSDPGKVAKNAIKLVPRSRMGRGTNLVPLSRILGGTNFDNNATMGISSKAWHSATNRTSTNSSKAKSHGDVKNTKPGDIHISNLLHDATGFTTTITSDTDGNLPPQPRMDWVVIIIAGDNSHSFSRLPLYATHGKQLSRPEKISLAKRFFQEGRDVGSMERQLGVHKSQLYEWLREEIAKRNAAEEAEILDLYLRCYTEEEISDKVKVPRQTVNRTIAHFSENGKMGNARPESIQDVIYIDCHVCDSMYFCAIFIANRCTSFGVNLAMSLPQLLQPWQSQRGYKIDTLNSFEGGVITNFSDFGKFYNDIFQFSGIGKTEDSFRKCKIRYTFIANVLRILHPWQSQRGCKISVYIERGVDTNLVSTSNVAWTLTFRNTTLGVFETMSKNGYLRILTLLAMPRVTLLSPVTPRLRIPKLRGIIMGNGIAGKVGDTGFFPTMPRMTIPTMGNCKAGKVGSDSHLPTMPPVAVPTIQTTINLAKTSVSRSIDFSHLAENYDDETVRNIVILDERNKEVSKDSRPSCTGRVGKLLIMASIEVNATWPLWIMASHTTYRSGHNRGTNLRTDAFFSTTNKESTDSLPTVDKCPPSVLWCTEGYQLDYQTSRTSPCDCGHTENFIDFGKIAENHKARHHVVPSFPCVKSLTNGGLPYFWQPCQKLSTATMMKP